MKWIVVSVLVSVIVGVTVAGYAQKLFSGVIAQSSNDEDHDQNGQSNNRPPDNRPPNRTQVIIVEKPVLPTSILQMLAMDNRSLALLERLLANTTAVSVNGTVIGLVNGSLLLRSDATQMSIFLPEVWNYNFSFVSRRALINGTFAGRGENVTVWALKLVLFAADGFDVNVMFGYKIMNASGAWAFAVLPFNIETKP